VLTEVAFKHVGGENSRW